MSENAKTVATFSIVAFDPETDSLGVAVQSKFLAVGALVPYARARVGAVAAQALAFGEHLVLPARPPRRMDHFEVSERLVQIYTSAGWPDDPYGAYHLLTLNYR